jgi:hypothetical protein
LILDELIVRITLQKPLDSDSRARVERKVAELLADRPFRER